MAALLVVTMSLMLSPAAAASQDDEFYLALVPPEGIGTTDQDSLAIAHLEVGVTDGTLCADIDTEGLTTPFTADIHRRGDGDPVVITLFTDSTAPDPSGCMPADPQLLREIVKDRLTFFLDIHTPESPDAVLAGNLGSDIVSQLGGAEVVPGPGDPDGTGVAWLVPFTTCCPNLFVFVNTSGIDAPTTVELRRGLPGSDGPLVASFPLNDPDGGASRTVDRKVIRDINRNAGGFYLEIVNQEFPGGALRGQLLS